VPSTGLYQAKVTTAVKRNSDNLGGVSEDQIQGFLNDWDLDFNNYSAGEVVFDCDISRAAASQAMHDKDVTLFDFSSEIQPNDSVNITCDYSLSSLHGNEILEGINARDMEVISHDVASKILVYNMLLSSIFAELKVEMMRELNHRVMRKRFVYPESIVDQAIAKHDIGEVLALTKDESISLLTDEIDG